MLVPGKWSSGMWCLDCVMGALVTLADYEQRPSRHGSGGPTGRIETQKEMPARGTHGARLPA